MPPSLDDIQRDFRDGNFRFTQHASARLRERGIRTDEVEAAVLSHQAEVIEDYPSDCRGASCLLLGFISDDRPLHVQLSYPPFPEVITMYEPGPIRWEDLRVRRT